MARLHKDPDGIGRVIDMFPAGSAAAIERILRRAREQEAREAGRAVEEAMRGIRPPGGGFGRLVGELGRALAVRRTAKDRPSVRQAAPGTGGRTFHFSHSVVSKEAAQSAGRVSAYAGGAGKGAGRAAAHMRYIEREVAVERLHGQGAEAGRDDPGSLGRGGSDRERSEGWEREAAAIHASSAGAGQGYLENATKLENGEHVTFSFGTIGEQFQDRVRFWEALEQAEAHPRARVQHRLILELPHEASPAARFDMVRRFCERFSDDGVPFWAALHAPGSKNDARNFHAHIVYSERPAKRMANPETGEEMWDFEVIRTRKKKSRNTVTTRPFRQDKLRDYNDRDFIRKRRKEFSDIVNELLNRDDVRDQNGTPVRYDARSYKDMGLDAVPLRSINRIVADRARDGAATVLDADYTRRMIAAALQEAAMRQDRDLLKVVALEETIRAATMSAKPRAGKGGPRTLLPPELRSPNLGLIPRAALKAAGDRILAARREALRNTVMERVTMSALERVIEATAPAPLAGTSNVRTGAKQKNGQAQPAPDIDAARLLHEAAVEELAEVRAAAAKARLTARHRVGAAVQAWREIVDAPSTTTSPALRRRLAEMEREEAEARRAAPAARAPEQPGASVEAGAAPTGRTASAHEAPAGPTTDLERSDPPRGATPRGRADKGAPPRSTAAPTRGREGPISTPAGLTPGLERHAIRGLSGGALLDAVNEDVRRLMREAIEGVDDASERARRLVDMAQWFAAAVRERRDDAIAKGLVPESYAREVAAMKERGEAARARAAAQGSTPAQSPGTATAPAPDEAKPTTAVNSEVVDASPAAAKPLRPDKGQSHRPADDASTSPPPATSEPLPHAAPAKRKGTEYRGNTTPPADRLGSRAAVQLDLGLESPTKGATRTAEEHRIETTPADHDQLAVETDDDRRRREREEDLESRRKKRKAVLGQKNRDRGWSR